MPTAPAASRPTPAVSPPHSSHPPSAPPPAPSPLLTTGQVCRLINDIDDRTLLRFRRTRNFPQPIRLGHRTYRYDADRVYAWIRAAAANRGDELLIDWAAWDAQAEHDL